MWDIELDSFRFYKVSIKGNITICLVYTYAFI